jgi:hypothetical protein
MNMKNKDVAVRMWLYNGSKFGSCGGARLLRVDVHQKVMLDDF